MAEQIYQVGGTLDQTAVSYVERQADINLLGSLRNGEYCYVFNARQMGKSSLLVRTAHRLRQAGYYCALVDFSRIGSEHISPQQWYSSFLVELVRSLDGSLDLLAACPEIVSSRTYLQQLSNFIDTVLLPYCCDRNIIIFLDEIDSLQHLPFSTDDFFAWIRSCYNQRALKTNYRQITFALFGVTTPRHLIQDPHRTPFNVGTHIWLQGLRRTEATPLLTGLQQLPWSAEALLDEILHWTGGQPLLTQKLCWMISQQSHQAVIPEAITVSGWMANLIQSQLVDNWQTQDIPQHFRTIRDWVLADEHQAGRLLGLYQQILHTPVLVDGSLEQTMLLLSGLVFPVQGKLQIKNPIYRKIFSLDWVNNELSQLRPYAATFSAWVASQQTDTQHLLQGLALQQALDWAHNKHLSDDDYRYLSASQFYAQQQIEHSLKLEQQAREIVQHSLEMADMAHTKLNQARQRARQRPLPNPAFWLTGIGLAVTSLMIVLRLSGILQFAEWLALDLFFQQRITSAAQQPITIIEITEDDLQQLNRFPLSDAVLAEAIEAIQQSRPALIGLDIYRDLAVEPGALLLDETLTNSDNVIGIYKHVNPSISPPEALTDEQLGFADQVVDSDGKVRRALLSLKSEEQVQYSFSLQLALRYLERYNITPQAQKHYMQLGQAQLYPFQSNDGGYVRADSGGYQILLNYHGPKTVFSVFSLGEVLTQQLPDEALADQIVLLGYTAESSNDFFQTPHSTRLFESPQRMSGVVLQANTLAMLLTAALDGRSLLRVWSPLVEQLWTILWIALGGLLGWQLQALWRVSSAVIVGSGMLIGIAFIGFILGWWIPWVPPVLGFTLTALLFPSLTDRILFRHRLRQTVNYLHQLTHQQPGLFALGLTFLKQAEGRKHEMLIDTAAQRFQP
ncbi:MAG: CHASE2 domain-containing protein [Cyanobacteria bacterium J06632_22]